MLISTIERQIRGQRALPFTAFALQTASSLLRVVPASKLRRVVASGRMLVNFQQNQLIDAEAVLAHFVRYERPDDWMITSYIARVVNPGHAAQAETITRSALVADDLKPLILAASARAMGDADAALDILADARSQRPEIRFRYADARKSIFHERGDHRAIAQAGVDFLTREPDAVHLPFTISVAASAEGAECEPYFASAVRRILDDLKRVGSDDELLRQHWKAAVDAALTVFDFNTADALLTMVIERRGNASAQRRRAEIAEMREQLAPVARIVEDARLDIQRRAHGLTASDEDADALLVVPAAALRANRIDYPGFRKDLRRMVVAAGAAYAQRGMAVRGRGRIRTHGRVSFDLPSFSYHTVSDSCRGLHFKETDRPHQFSIDRRGYAGWSAFSDLGLEDLKLETIDPVEADAFFRQDQDRVIAGNVTKYRQSDEHDVLPSDYVFVALQLIGDAVQANAHVSPIEMLEIVLEVCGRLGIPVVVKRHPQCRSAAIASFLERRKRTGELTIARGSIHRLIANARGVCVQNSSVGSEALLHGKPVYTFGRSDYMAATIQVTSPAILERALLDRQALPDETLKRFWYMYRRNYSSDISALDDEELRAMIGRALDEAELSQPAGT